MKKGEFDNDYYFYENGQILHVYDKSKMKVNIEKFVSSLDISEHEKMQMIKDCPEEYKERVICMLAVEDKE